MSLWPFSIQIDDIMTLLRFPKKVKLKLNIDNQPFNNNNAFILQFGIYFENTLMKKLN